MELQEALKKVIEMYYSDQEPPEHIVKDNVIYSNSYVFLHLIAVSELHFHAMKNKNMNIEYLYKLLDLPY